MKPKDKEVLTEVITSVIVIGAYITGAAVLMGGIKKLFEKENSR